VTDPAAVVEPEIGRRYVGEAGAGGADTFEVLDVRPMTAPGRPPERLVRVLSLVTGDRFWLTWEALWRDEVLILRVPRKDGWK
jgi:hypothetical protein